MPDPFKGGLSQKELARRADELIDDRKAVVKILNKLRKEHGLGSTSRVKKGIAMHRRCCPVAMTLKGTNIVGVDVQTLWIVESDEPDSIRSDERRGSRVKKVLFTELLPKEEAKTLARFVRHIDQGLYPELCIPLSVVKVKGEVVE